MNKTYIMIITGIFISLVFLQISCGTVKEYRAEEVSAEAEEEVEEVVAEGPLLLGDKHKASGIECSDCHEESPPAGDVSSEVCLSCHEDYNEVAASYIDPHNAHVVYTRCGDCHHAHYQSQNQCLSCHYFNIEVP